MTGAQELMQLNTADYIIAGIIFVSMLISLVRGFFKELISLVIWFIGFWVATKFYTQLSIIFQTQISNVSIRLIVSFVVIFLSVLILGAIFSHILSFIITKTGLSGFDRLLGMIFGCARGVLLVSIVLLLISTTSFVEDNWWKKSVFVPHLHVVVDWLRVFLPQKITNLATMVESKQFPTF